MFGSRVGPSQTPSPARSDSSASFSISRRVVLGRGVSTDDVFGRSGGRRHEPKAIDIAELDDLEDVMMVEDDGGRAPAATTTAAIRPRAKHRPSAGARAARRAARHAGSPSDSPARRAAAELVEQLRRQPPTISDRAKAAAGRRAGGAGTSPISGLPGGPALTRRDQMSLTEAVARRQDAEARASELASIVVSLKSQISELAARHLDEKVRGTMQPRGAWT